jgi:hypothetical protein
MSGVGATPSPVKRRLRAEYRTARAEARLAAAELASHLRRRGPLRQVAKAADRARRAAAHLYTAAACLLSPP